MDSKHADPKGKDLKDFNRSLTPLTSLILTSLSEISELSNFTLVGGSALSIHH